MTAPSQHFLAVCASHAPGMVATPDHSIGTGFRSGLEEVRRAVADFAPELVVMFGSDHRRAYEPVIPAISVVLSAEGYGDHGSPTGTYNVPEIASDLAAHLLNQGFDVAASRRVRLDHGFGETFGFLLGSLDAVPVLPIFINCATPPLAPARRAVDLGEAVYPFIKSLDATRVLIVGSGGLSHSPPTLEVDTLTLSDAERQQISRAGRAAAVEKINPEWDHEFLRRLASSDSEWLEDVSADFIANGGVGANEIRTWLAVWAASGKEPLATVAYEPVREWITGMGVVSSARIEHP